MPGHHAASNRLLTIFPDSHDCHVFFTFVKSHVLISIVVFMTPENQNKVSYIAFSYVDCGVIYYVYWSESIIKFKILPDWIKSCVWPIGHGIFIGGYIDLFLLAVLANRQVRKGVDSGSYWLLFQRHCRCLSLHTECRTDECWNVLNIKNLALASCFSASHQSWIFLNWAEI